MRLIIALACVVLSHPSFADKARDREQAAQLFRNATRLYNLAEYAAALVDFKAAYRRRPDPGVPLQRRPVLAPAWGLRTRRPSVGIGDFKGDGKVDAAVANYNGLNVTIFLNTSM